MSVAFILCWALLDKQNFMCFIQECIYIVIYRVIKYSYTQWGNGGFHKGAKSVVWNNVNIEHIIQKMIFTFVRIFLEQDLCDLCFEMAVRKA